MLQCRPTKPVRMSESGSVTLIRMRCGKVTTCVFIMCSHKDYFTELHLLHLWCVYVYIYICMCVCVCVCVCVYTRVSRMKTLNIFYLVIYWTHKVHNDIIFLRSLHCVPYRCSSASEVHGYLSKKILLAESAATRAPPAAPLRRTWKTSLPSPLWVIQRRESHLGRGLASTADVEGTRRTNLGLLQQLNGQYGAEHCHVVTKHLYSEVHVVWTWWQDAGDYWGGLHTVHWSQCSPWACSAPKLPRVHPKRESA